MGLTPSRDMKNRFVVRRESIGRGAQQPPGGSEWVCAGAAGPLWTRMDLWTEENKLGIRIKDLLGSGLGLRVLVFGPGLSFTVDLGW